VGPESIFALAPMGAAWGQGTMKERLVGHCYGILSRVAKLAVIHFDQRVTGVEADGTLLGGDRKVDGLVA